MTKQQLLEAVSVRTDKTRAEVETILDAILEQCTQALAAGERVDLRGFGSFVVKERKARQGRNPKTGESIAIAAKHAATFKPSKELTEKLSVKAPPES